VTETPLSPVVCPDCGARYASGRVECADHFAELLALDHSRTEPWGSRHGLAFSVFALQHAAQYPPRVRAGAWRMLQRVYVQGADRRDVAAEMRALGGALPAQDTVAPLPAGTAGAPAFTVTIADVWPFDAERYAEQLDAWCRATLDALTAR
jgi:hypothetical protein